MNTSKQSLFQQFMRTSTALRRIITKFSNVSLEDKMATMLQCEALTYLSEHDKATVGALTQELEVTSPAIAQLTDRLVNAGWIIREHDQHDRRIVHLLLTDEGKIELFQMRQKHFEMINPILSLISEKDLQELIRIQTELVQKLEKGHKNHER